MCGIFALLNNIHSHKHIDYNTINNEFMKGKSRGPEHSILESVSIDLLFGFHRLAINGLNPASNQPMKINNIILICNGEIYNYNELYNLLDINPHTDSDCEIIIHLYIKQKKSVSLIWGHGIDIKYRYVRRCTCIIKKIL